MSTNKNPKVKWIVASIATITILVASIFVLNSNKKKSVQVEKVETAPIKKIKGEPFQTFEIDAEKDTNIYFKTGSIIRIPAQAFVTLSGAPVKGKVKLHYREFHNVGEILLSEISMRYDSAGVRQDFESAGMFEMNATQNNDTLGINASKSIEVNLASLDNAKSKYNQYYFDEKIKQWKFEKKDVAQIFNKGKKENSMYGQTKAANVLAPLKPKLADMTRPRFKININKNDFPELSGFNKLLFEVAPETKNYNESTSKINWSNVDIKKEGVKNLYKITFTNESKECVVIAYPVFEQKYYDEAMEKYTKMLAVYEAQKKVRIENENAKQKWLEREVELNTKLGEKFRDLYNEGQANMEQANTTVDVVYRTFQVQNFGIWNSDCPRSMPAGIDLIADFRREDGTKASYNKIVLVEKGRNMLFSFYTNHISFNPESDNTFILVGKDNSISWCNAKEISSVNKKDDYHEFKVKTIRKNAYTSSDINSLML